MREYQIGSLARIKGLPRSVNPFPRGVSADLWECGWRDADDYLKKEKLGTR
jgi:hypothetical protein